ncbi:structure-specific endonuclease subunit slx1 isoform X1 [Neltuma alba]|uniref:structure-specific endonuclease subunit slx1-like isoform X1 n=1 Tax=Neltuma alba TaxID=207710 RepID=UPI0010A3ABC6|nr:structure-specific endonuclease subunit slx1-like isoform X1 [Prosopis alba]XP_028768945.1 structure-specific endonuclease subunit slx1 isoform X1 [Prosopis alba]
MRKRKARSESSKPLNPRSQAAAIEEQNTVSDEAKGFFACYLLVSLNPRFKGHTYIGFTVNPRRRIRQHNGEIGCGAWRTKRRRPWEMVLCIYGFPTNVSALQFEWAWQHPVESLAVRKAAATFKSLSGIANKVKLAYTMLTLPSWQSLNMTVNFFSTKYTKHSAGCPSLPEHMKVHIRPMDELPCYTERIKGLSENEDDDTGEGGDTSEEECSVITSNSDSIPDTINGCLTHLSPQDEESEAREPCHSFASLDKSQPFGSIISEVKKSPPVILSTREEVIEVKDFTNFMNKSSAEMSQADCIQSGTISAANKSKDSRCAFNVPSEAEIIDLSTPSACRSFSASEKRISRVGNDFIDLTKSPGFIQL